MVRDNEEYFGEVKAKMIKLRSWEMMLVRMIALPILRRISARLVKKAGDTPEEWDDILAEAFQTVIAFFENPGTFKVQDKK